MQQTFTRDEVLRAINDLQQRMVIEGYSTVLNWKERLGFGRDEEANECDIPEKYVLLEGISTGKRFFSSYTEGEDPTLSATTGEVWYKILGYADSVEDAQMKLYGQIYK